MIKILGQVFKEAREDLGFSIEELAQKATLSKRQLLQIEEGGYDAFYSPVIQIQSAKKVAKILGLSNEDAFEVPVLDISLTQNVDASNIAPVKDSEQESGLVDGSSKLRHPVGVWGSGGRVVLSVCALVSAYFIGAGVQVEWPHQSPWLSAWPFVGQTEETHTSVVELEDAGVESVAAEPQSQHFESAETSLKIPVDSACGVLPNPYSPIPEFTPSNASKVGNQVYVLNKGQGAQAICFQDADANFRQASVLAGEGFNFIGKPPFIIFSKGLNQFDIYYQGYKAKVDSVWPIVLLREAQI